MREAEIERFVQIRDVEMPAEEACALNMVEAVSIYLERVGEQRAAEVLRGVVDRRLAAVTRRAS